MSKTNYSVVIKNIRESRGLSQAFVAKELGIARTSYIAVEQCKREFTVSEAQKISEILAIDFFDVFENKEQKREKYKQMLFYFLRLFKKGNGRYKRVPKTKLAKLLYLADFANYYNNLQSMSGLQYRKIDFGPVPDDYFYLLEELRGAGEISIEETNKAHLIGETRLGERVLGDLLSNSEKSLMRKIYKHWEKAKTDEIVAFTHHQLPYEFADYKEIIPYELILQEDHENIY